jgi:nucleoside-diphosphate-sugar epimerase
MTQHTYFITGGFGFLGQYIVKYIREHDPRAELRVQVRTPRPTLLGIEAMPDVHLISGELSQPGDFAGVMNGVDTVIHSAALVSFKAGDNEALRQSNIVGTQNLLQAAIDHGCRNFIFISSVSAIGRKPGKPSDETMIPDLEEKRRVDLYGYSKLMGERAVQAEAGRIRSIILNPSVILGPGSRRIEQTFPLLHWIPFYPMLSTVNSFVDVRDVATAVVLALSKGRSGERYIVTAENVDMLTFTRTVLAAMGKKAPVFPIPNSLLVLGDALVWLLDALRINPGLRRFSAMNMDKVYTSEKIRREMGWLPAFTLEQSLYDSYRSDAGR